MCFHSLGKPTLASFYSGLYIIEIGGDDYLAAFAVNKTPEYVDSNLVPLVTRKIRVGIEVGYQISLSLSLGENTQLY